MKIRLIASATLMALIVTLGLFQWASYLNRKNSVSIRALTPPPTPAEIELMRAQDVERDVIKRGGEHYKPLKMVSEFPGHVPSELLTADSVTLPSSTEVVGVEVAGECCAFVLDSMSNPRYHIINMLINMRPISVTYCDLANCVRVLTSEDSNIIPLHVGGLDIGNQMVLLYGGERFSQSSANLPLKDHDFVRTTLGEWMEMHPATKVYVGPEE